MTEPLTRRRGGPARAPLFILGVGVVVWGLVGLVQHRARGVGGYRINGAGTVVVVDSGGPADRAGLETGDWIIEVSGTDGRRFWKKPLVDRAGIGETQSLVVGRDGERLPLDIVWEAPSGLQVRAWTVGDVVTLAFVGFGLWALLSAQTLGGVVLAVFGIAYGAANFAGPSPGFSHGIVDFMQQNLSFFITAVLCHFFLVYPRRKWIARRRSAAWLIYFPFFTFVGVGLAAGVVHPALRSVYASWTAVTDLLYTLLALAALIHSWFATPSTERRASGLHLVFVGLAVSFLPFVALALIGLAVPGFTLPGSDYLPLLGIAIPASLALAVVRGAGTDTAPAAAVETAA